jgi:ABC-type molybdate transport system substrate-binding protein
MAEHSKHEPAVMVFGGSRRGRRRVTPGESVRLSVRIWSEHFDALQKDASRERVDFADYVRGILAAAASRKR